MSGYDPAHELRQAIEVALAEMSGCEDAAFDDQESACFAVAVSVLVQALKDHPPFPTVHVPFGSA